MPAAFMALNPNAKVPVIVDGATIDDGFDGFDGLPQRVLAAL